MGEVCCLARLPRLVSMMTIKQLEKWCRRWGYVTSRDGIDYQVAADALGISRRSMIMYVKGEAEIPRYLELAAIGHDTLKGDQPTA